MNFDELTRFLEKRVKLPMPGDLAHQRMKPKMADGAPLRLKHTTPPRKGGVLILLYEENDEVRFPLIQRPTYEGIHSGQMALPGGRFELGDRDLIDTALREANEEIGVDATNIEVLGNLSEFFVAASNYMVLPVVGKINYRPSFLPEPREVEEIVTPTIQQLVIPDNAREKEMTVRNGFRMLCPYYDLEDRVVWGATAMMLSELVEILKEFQR